MASTENKVELANLTGRANVASTGTAVQLSTTSYLCREVVISALTTNLYAFGNSTVDATSGAENGIILSAAAIGDSVTITVDSVEMRGLRGARQGERFLDLSELYVDADTSSSDVAWFAYM